MKHHAADTMLKWLKTNEWIYFIFIFFFSLRKEMRMLFILAHSLTYTISLFYYKLTVWLCCKWFFLILIILVTYAMHCNWNLMMEMGENDPFPPSPSSIAPCMYLQRINEYHGHNIVWDLLHVYWVNSVKLLINYGRFFIFYYSHSVRLFSFSKFRAGPSHT